MFSVIGDHLKKLEPDKDVSIILGDDCNQIFNSGFDVLAGKPFLKSNSFKQMYDIMSECDLIDIWRI